MKMTTLLAAMLALASLAACEKTTVNPPPTIVTPTVEVPAAAATPGCRSGTGTRPRPAPLAPRAKRRAGQAGRHRDRGS
ncbi:hypothetical protein LP420_05680 [Massilia sp. B-10]|nr:hypothetical protein LP420_05680 [Massilia sp. B-10]